MRHFLPGSFLLAVLASGCGGPSIFGGVVNNALFEPTGTVWGYTNGFTPAPALLQRTPEAFVLAGVYASFDPSTDQAGLAGSSQQELRSEIADNDWLVLTWNDATRIEQDTTYKAVVLRDDANDLVYRVADTAASDVTEGFGARLRFRRGTLQRGSAYTCPAYTPPPFCVPYHPVGGRARVEVQFITANRQQGGTLRARVTVTVEKRDGDPDGVQTPTLTGFWSGSVVTERVAEANMQLLDLYNVFGLTP